MDRIVIGKITSHEVESAMRLALEALTLNSSPYGSPFYLALGFIPLKYIIRR